MDSSFLSVPEKMLCYMRNSFSFKIASHSNRQWISQITNVSFLSICCPQLPTLLTPGKGRRGMECQLVLPLSTSFCLIDARCEWRLIKSLDLTDTEEGRTLLPTTLFSLSFAMLVWRFSLLMGLDDIRGKRKWCAYYLWCAASCLMLGGCKRWVPHKLY